MSNKEVLIAYGTRFGSTEEISREIEKILESKGLVTHLLDLKNTKERDWGSLESFDGILVGSSIKIGKWMKEPKKFLQKHRDELSMRKKILGLFVSSVYASVPEKKLQIKKDYLEKVIEEIGIEADIYDAFGGVLDFSKSSKMGFLDTKIAKIAVKVIAKEQGTQIDGNSKIDLRDWNQIRAFAETFAEFLS